MKQLEQLQKCYQVTHTRQDEGKKQKQTSIKLVFTSNTSKHLKPRKKQLIITKRHVTRFAAGSVLIGEKCTERVSPEYREEALWERSTLCPVENCNKWAVSTSVTLPLNGKQLAGTNHVWHKQTTNITLYSDMNAARHRNTAVFPAVNICRSHAAILPFP